MSLPLRVLLVKDTQSDVFSLLNELQRSSYIPLWEQVDTAEAMRKSLQSKEWDVVIADDFLSQFSALEALELLRATELDLPFIILCGALEEDLAVAMMNHGASDYLVKGNLKRLAPAIARELQRVEIQRKNRRLEHTLSQIERVKDEFVSLLNHELQTPIASLQGSIELLLTGHLGDLSERGQRMLEIAAGNTDRLVQVTNNMLDFEEFAAKKLPVFSDTKP
jgi:DNA-binding NtrC family response regulator